MTAEIVDFYPYWKKKQEQLRIASGLDHDVWYLLCKHGYDPSKQGSIDKFLAYLAEEEEE
jgi:hypothetical protein